MKEILSCHHRLKTTITCHGKMVTKRDCIQVLLRNFDLNLIHPEDSDLKCGLPLLEEESSKGERVVTEWHAPSTIRVNRAQLGRVARVLLGMPTSQSV